MKFLLFVLFSCFALLRFQYVYPYKHSDFLLSYNSKSITDLEYTLTFQVDDQIEPFNYLTISTYFAAFEWNLFAKIYDCNLQIFQETSGIYFSEKDLKTSSSSSEIKKNLIYSCEYNNGNSIFLTNGTIIAETVYQLKYKIDSPISKDFKGNLIHFYFSKEKDYYQTLLPKNDYYTVLMANILKDNVPGIIAEMRPIYITEDMKSDFAQVLNSFIDTYEIAFYKKQSFGVASFNQMIQNLNYKNKIEYESLSSTLENYVLQNNFLGNFIIEIPAANLGIQAFSLFEIIFPVEVGLNQTTTDCISIEFKDYHDTSKIATYFEHTKCKINVNKVSFYNVYNIPNEKIRIMITDVNNPSLPGNYQIYLTVSSPAKKLVYFKQTIGMSVQSNSFNINLDNSIQSHLEKTYFFNENVQSMKFTFSLIESDFNEESMMELSFDPEYSIPFGNDCVIPNISGLWSGNPRTIECKVDAKASKIRVKYIPFLFSSEKYTLYFFMKNKKEGTAKLAVDIYSFNRKQNKYYEHSSVSNKIDYIIEKVGLNIKDIYFLDSDNNKIFNANFVSTNELKIIFSLPADQNNYESKVGDNIKLMMNSLIEIDSGTFTGGCLIEELSKEFPCNFYNELDMNYISIDVPEGTSFFTGESFTLSIKGLSYNKVYESPYKFSFEYYLIYSLSDLSKKYIGMKKAELSLPALTSPESTNIVLIGGIGSDVIPKSLIKAKLFSPRLSELDPVMMQAIYFNSLMVHFYLKNFDYTDFKNEEAIFFKKSEKSNIRSFFTQAIDEESENFREWTLVTFYDVQLSNGDFEVEIPLRNAKNKQGEAIVVFYLNVDDLYFLPFDQYKLSARQNYQTSDFKFSEKIEINWEYQDPEQQVKIQQNSLFTASFDFMFDDQQILSQIIASKTIFVLYYFNWNIVQSANITINCEGSDGIFYKLSTTSIYKEKSKTFLIFQIEDFDSIPNSGFYGNIICYNFLAPYASDPNNLYSAFISDKNGNIISGKLPSDIQSEFKFDKINLFIQKSSFTPNVLNAPSSHLALYFNSFVPLSFPGSIKLIIPSEFESAIKKIKEMPNSKLFTKAYLSLLRSDHSYYEDFQDDLYFKFDKYEYKSKPITSLPQYIQEPLKLDITLLSESIIENDNNLVIKINVNSQVQITREHLLLLEIFNLQTPTNTHEAVLKLQYELEDQKPIAIGEITHKFSTDSINPTFSVSDVNIFSIKDFRQPLLSIEINFNDIIFPNYVFAITAPTDFATQNQQGFNDFIFQVACENSDTPVILPKNNEASMSQFQNRLLQDETSDSINSDSANSSPPELFSLTSAANNNQENFEYKKPYVTNKNQLNSDYLIAVEPPSLSGRTLKFFFLNFWADDTKDLEFTVSLFSNYDNSTPEKIYTQLVKAGSSTLTQNDQIQIENVSNDLEVENVESDFSIKITTNFDIAGKPFYLYLNFGGDIILREDNKFLIDGKQYQGLIEAGKSVMLNFQYSRNLGKSFVLSIPNLKKSYFGSCIASIIFKNDRLANQKILSMRKTRINYGSRNIVITELKFSDLKTYNTVDVHFSIRYEIFRAIEIDDVIRFIFPKDFPTVAEYEASNKCEIKICEDETFKICSIIDSTCRMIDNYVNLAFKKKLVPKGTENQQIFDKNVTIFANITIFGIKTSPNNGKIGSISVFSYGNPDMFYLGENSPVTDEYVYPVLIKDLYSIYRVTDPESNVDLTTIDVLSGTIKRIFLKDFLGLTFKNEMSLNIIITGNDKITFFGAGEKPFTKTILIKNGDLIKHFDLKIDQEAEFYVAYLRFSLTSNTLKYQDIPPLKILIWNEEIQISIVTNIQMTKGISSFLHIKLSEFPVDPLTITITPSSANIKILGGNQIKFNSTNIAYFFRIRSTINGELSYTLSSKNYYFAGQMSTSKIIVSNANDTIITNTLTFAPSFIPGVGSITINVILDNFEAFLYYQIFDIKNNVAEIPNYRIVESLENANLMKMNLEGSTIGIQECNTTYVICKTKIEGLDVSNYKVKVFIVSYNNVTSNVVIRSLEVLSIRPLVMDFGLSNKLTEIQKNNFLCSISEFLGLNPLLIYSEDNLNCHFDLFANSKSASLTSNFIEESSLLLNSNSITVFTDMDVSKLQNLRPAIITNLFLNFEKMQDLEQVSLENSLKIYIYPSSESPDFNLTLYSEKFEDLTIAAYFKSIFPQIDFDFFLKSTSVLGKTNSIDSFLPILVGTPLILVDVNSIKITIELSDEAIVFGVAVLGNVTKPTSSQITKGMNSDGVIENNCIVKNIFDKNGVLNPISLVFEKLKTDTTYNVYFVVGLYIPGKDIVGNNIYVVSATPTDPYKKIGPRVLSFEDKN